METLKSMCTQGEYTYPVHQNCSSVSRVLQTTDPKHPFNFSKVRKMHIIVTGIVCAFSGTMGSSLPSNATSSISSAFTVPLGSTYLVLLNSLFMVGFAISPLFLGPLSETLGRRPVLVGALTLYALLTMCCALSPTYDVLLVFRALAGMTATCANAVVPGVLADTFHDPRIRGRAMSSFLLSSAMGPLAGPLISGFVSRNLGWRWVFWIALIIIGACLPIIWLVPETYVPILERKMFPPDVSKSEKQPGTSERIQVVAEFLTRPIRMMYKEPILLLSSSFLSFEYALMYLVFQAYPIVFGSVYGMTQDKVGLAYIPLMFGCAIAFVVFQLYSNYHAEAVTQKRAWALVEEYRRLPLACIGGPCVTIALLVLGFTSRPSIHPAVPMIVCGLFFGTGYLLLFLAMLIYLSDVYKKYTASAQAGASTMRSIAAICLPFAAPSMYGNLGVRNASVLLACASVVMASVPFIFLLFGRRLKSNSVYSG